MPLVPMRFLPRICFHYEHYIKLLNIFKPPIFFAFAFLTCKIRAITIFQSNIDIN